MDEFRNLIAQYDAYYEMADDNTAWRRGAAIGRRLGVQGHGRIDGAVPLLLPARLSRHGSHRPVRRQRTVAGRREELPCPPDRTARCSPLIHTRHSFVQH